MNKIRKDRNSVVSVILTTKKEKRKPRRSFLQKMGKLGQCTDVHSDTFLNLFFIFNTYSILWEFHTLYFDHLSLFPTTRRSTPIPYQTSIVSSLFKNQPSPVSANYILFNV